LSNYRVPNFCRVADWVLAALRACGDVRGDVLCKNNGAAARGLIVHIKSGAGSQSGRSREIKVKAKVILPVVAWRGVSAGGRVRSR
jgi:hypothetical protein